MQCARKISVIRQAVQYSNCQFSVMFRPLSIFPHLKKKKTDTFVWCKLVCDTPLLPHCCVLNMYVTCSVIYFALKALIFPRLAETISDCVEIVWEKSTEFTEIPQAFRPAKYSKHVFSKNNL